MEPEPSPRGGPKQREWYLDPDLDALDPSSEEEGQPYPSLPLKRVPAGDIFEAARAGDIERLGYLLESGVNVNGRDQWDSAALYYTCLAGHADAARLLLDSGAICSERTFDGDRCHYAALNLRIRRLLKSYEARPPPLGPLPSALRAAFLGCPANRAYLQHCAAAGIPGYSLLDDMSGLSFFPPDIIFFVEDRAIEAHRVILSSRSPFFKTKFQMDWKERKEVRFSRGKLSFSALYSLIHFFYSDRLEVAVNDMEDLIRLCKACRCKELQEILQKELRHQKNADYKALREVDDSQKRFILQGSSLPEQDRLPSSMRQILQRSLSNLRAHQSYAHEIYGMEMGENRDDLADVCIEVDRMIFRCHQVVLASRSEYFKARLSRMEDFLEGRDRVHNQSLPCFEEHDISAEAFARMLEYMYTDSIEAMDPDQAEEIFDAASRYLLFSLKKAVADVLLPHLKLATPAELCHWLMLSDMYGVLKLREYCLDTIACNFETFADAREFRAMLLTLPPPSGDSSLRTTLPSAPGSGVNSDLGNILDDLREKWLEAEAAELDKRDESAALFDRRLEMLMLVAEQESRGLQSDV